MIPETIAFLGDFGTHNLGNECTLQAAIQHVRSCVPEAVLSCICPEPTWTAAARRMPAVLLSYRYARAAQSRAPRPSGNALSRFLTRVLFRLPLELLEWVRALRALKGTGTLVMTGTGMLSDFGTGGPFGLHYQLLKWSVAAKLRRWRVLFLSVGAGPIEPALSRWMVKTALSLADYRSYRDRYSREYLESIGFDASRDPVYPDLAFSFRPCAARAGESAGEGGRTVGLGLMEFRGLRDTPDGGVQIHAEYIQRVSAFARWLLESGHTVRLIVGDLSYDTGVKKELYDTLRRTQARYRPEQIIDEPVTSVDELWAQLARTDVVVATRFHNLVLALMQERPVLALSYHPKIQSLMADMGLQDYCQDVATLDVARLIEQFRSLELHAPTIRSAIARQTAEYRRSLAEQYQRVLRAEARELARVEPGGALG